MTLVATQLLGLLSALCAQLVLLLVATVRVLAQTVPGGRTQRLLEQHTLQYVLRALQVSTVIPLQGSPVALVAH